MASPVLQSFPQPAISPNSKHFPSHPKPSSTRQSLFTQPPTIQEDEPAESSSRIPAVVSRRSRLQVGLDILPSEWDIFLLSTCMKMLLFPAYRSTDFEVHRNWLAITHSLPLSKWYYDTTSEWSEYSLWLENVSIPTYDEITALDYPPFFAYFEKLLSIPAFYIDPLIVDLNNLNYGAWSVVVYQRSTVILTELVLGLVLLKFIRGATDPTMHRIISASLFMHPGFIIVDHIHFQYNGFMYGILLWSILMARNGNKLTSGVLFAVLLNFKHIYMYLAPAYFVYLLRTYCMSPAGEILPVRFLSLANAVILVFLSSLGPFVLMGQLPQLLSRLFPFTRGLNHAYWAPNAWALVTALDRVLLKFAGGTGLDIPINESGVASSSRGLVGDTIFAVLPNVKPLHTFAVTIAVLTVFMAKLWATPTYKSFLTALTLCGYTSFMFGWHVHEKAVLLVLVPLSLLATENHAYFRTFTLASIAGIYSLFPLLFTPAESVVKLIYTILWAVLVLGPIHRRIYDFPRSLPFVIIDVLERAYLYGFVALHLVVSILAWFVGRSQTSTMEFLPLMMTSVYCAFGLVWAFIRLSVLYLQRK